MSDIAITTKEVAARLGISVASVNARIKSGRIPVARLGREGFHRAEFERWLREGTPVAIPQTPPEPTAQSISINAGGVTLCITIEIRPEQPACGGGLRMVANG